MLLEIRGHHFPGRFWHVDADPCDNLHVGLQVHRDATDLVRGDTETAVWSTDITALTDPGLRVMAHVDLTDEYGGPRCARLRPPAVQVSRRQVS